MKPRLLVFLSLFSFSCALYGADFPGLKAVMSPEDWQRAGLDRLSPDELGVVDAALIRFLAAKPSQPSQPSTNTTTSAPLDRISDPNNAKRGTWDRFGLPNLFGDTDWRKMPPLRAKVTGWSGGNRFQLDNGQVWEGSEPIPYELPGMNIEIYARPHGQFALFVNGNDTRLRIIRLR